MNEIQSYLDAFYFLVEHTGLLSRFGLILVISIIMGAIVLDRFKVWRWSIVLIVFLIVTQYQVNSVLRELGYVGFQILQPHVITIVSAFFFAVGSGIGYWIKKKFYLAYTNKSPEIVAKEILAEVNGGEIEPCLTTQTIIR